jgi:hypothetical protein
MAVGGYAMPRPVTHGGGLNAYTEISRSSKKSDHEDARKDTGYGIHFIAAPQIGNPLI